VDEAIQTSLIEGAGTVLAALLAATAAVLTWYLATRDERRRASEEVMREAERAQAERQHVREEERSAREQRVIDIVTAIHAEICATMRGLELQTQPAEETYFINNDDPFVVADDTDFVFASISSDLTILPETVIHEVVAYYKVAKQTNLLTAAIDRPTFRSQSVEERRKFITGLLELAHVQRSLAAEALAQLEEFRPALRAKRLWLAVPPGVKLQG
jgi:type II secretory pathway pseudopilin PulG